MPKRRYTIGYATTDYKDIVVAKDMAIEIKWIWVTNRSGSAATLELAHVPSGASPDETMDLMHDYSLDANAMLSLECLVYMNPGDRIAIKASGANALVVNIYADEKYFSGVNPTSQEAYDAYEAGEMGNAVPVSNFRTGGSSMRPRRTDY